MAHDFQSHLTQGSGAHPTGAQGEAAVDAHGNPLHPPHAHGGHAPSLGTYFVIFVTLLVLLLVTVIIAKIPTAEVGYQRVLQTFVGYTIAVIKATLIILFFMHVKGSSRLMWVFSTAAFFWLAIMILMTGADYASRGNVPGAMRDNDPLPVTAEVQSHGTADRPRPEGNPANPEASSMRKGDSRHQD